MRDIHVWVGGATVGANAIACVIGAIAWAFWANPKAFWWTLRAGQALVIVSAVIGSVLLLEGRDLPRLHLVYALTPVAVSFLAEQLRIVTTPTFLEQRGLESGKDVAKLPQIEQQALVSAILRRELAIMATSAGVVATLVARAQLWF
ncbi:hypothetical protein DVA67_021470 [Solirubrobacter sp. CPCC 204708]|uniref:DUF1772 domain-containing protein n=1 Tax=Solirubrobacter deserti TaxID=2282478 RepID=A0ABT4REU5_9ACTN|nr:hypothetical protein [Solirubrobacter deserti]MBE2318565.1 hypothetical protein [Solirubrobacter deserti]MDA0137023.1 hypothetical protein [Solirubrobacter deserti]